MEDGNSNVNLGSTGLDVGKPDPTQNMPPFPQGPEVNSLSIEDAQKEWQAMTIDPDGKYKGFPRSVFSSRRDELFKRGFGEKIEQDQKTQEEKGREWLEKENRKIEDRDDLDRERRSKELGVKFFGSEKEFDRMIEGAVETVKGLSKENRDFLHTETPNSQFCYGDLPFIISLLAGIRKDADLIDSINKIGLEKLVNLANKSGIFGRRQKR